MEPGFSRQRPRFSLRYAPEHAGGQDRMTAFRIALFLMLAWTAPLRDAVAEQLPVQAVPRWQTLPPTPILPEPLRSGIAPVNGIEIWYAVFGQGSPVILLHGGLANSDYWGLQVPPLARHHQVIVMDSRGHGRSSRDDRPFGYDLMAEDVAGLMNFLGIPKAAIIGWSDGAILGLDLAIRHPERVTRLFAFAANTDPSGVVEGLENNPTFAAFFERAGTEYEKLSPTPTEHKSFVAAITRMWATEPNFTPDQLRSIRIPVEIADGDHDEAIKRPHTEAIAATIPGAGLLIEPNVSHFAFLQDPVQFTEDVLHFLDETPWLQGKGKG
jgi:pimeloyl-ACP methyl ester carboxylesterase